MTTRHREEFTAPVQLESLLEVPVKIILIEDLIREKAALASSGSFQSTSLDSSSSKNRDTDDESDNRTGGDRLPTKKCLFDCCATPSRWRDTDCFSNNSQFRTANIALPWHDTVAVIPVMQVEKSRPHVSSIVDISTNEDTDTDIEMNNKNSDDETRLSPDVVPLSLTTNPSKNAQVIRDNNNDSDKEINLIKQPINNDPKISQHEKVLSTNPQPIESSSRTASPTTPSAVVVHTASALLGKVTEKPTRYEDFIIAHCSNTSSSNNNSCNTITPRKGQDVIRDSDTVSQGSNNSADDTLKLTFYNEARKEPTKEFRGTCIESGGASSSTAAANDIRYFENQGLQMSRVIRESGAIAGVEETARIRQPQQPVVVEEAERSTDKTCTNDNTQNYSKNPNNSTNSITGNSGEKVAVAGASPIITQSQQLRLTSSIIQNINSSNDAKNSTNASNNNNNNATQQGRQWQGLQISRCQKEVNSVITLDGESSNGSNVSNREINSESSLATTTTTGISNPPEKEKGETENSIERHLQTYLTSLKYVKPAESGNEKSDGHEGESSSNKHRSPLTTPPSRHTTSNITSPTSSPGSASGQGAVAGVAKMPNIQRVSPSQQASSLESWPERTIARIPTRPFLRRNTTYEQQPLQQQPLQQQQHQAVALRPPYHSPGAQQQQPRMLSTPTPAAATAAVPLHSPPKRFKAAIVPTPSPLVSPHPPPPQQHQQQLQYYQQQGFNTLNRNSQVSNAIVAPQHPCRSVTGNTDHSLHMPQQQRVPTATTPHLARISTPHQHQPYNNLQHYNQRPASAHHLASTPAVSNIVQPPHHSPATAQLLYGQHQHQPQHQQYQMKCPANSNPQSQQQQQQQQHHQQQQQLQFQRHLHESLLIASNAMASSSEPTDSAYNERLRRYCEFYHRQELDVGKLQEYYKKYGFYPWDILTARDESIIRQMRTQEQHQQHKPVFTAQHADAAEGQNIARYETVRRMEVVESATLQHYQQQQQQHQRQVPVRPAVNLAHSPGRVAPNFSPQMSHQSQAATVAGNPQSGVPLPIVSPQASASIQNRYNHNAQPQHIQHLNQREYGVSQQQLNNRYYQPQQHDNQTYRHPQEIKQQQQPRIMGQEGNLPTNYDIQNSPHYRSAYNQLAAAAAAVSSVAGTAAVAVPQSTLRSNDSRPVTNTAHPVVRDERVAHLLHSQSGVGVRPVVMTVADPVPAPPEAVPLSIHRQALEQAIKNNQVAATGRIGSMHGGVVESRNDADCRLRDQRRSSPSPHSQAHRQIVQHPHQGQPYTVSRARIDEGAVAVGVHAVNKEPLRIAPSPTLAQQTSVIRRIQQQESSPSTASAFAPGINQQRCYLSDRPGISYRRISNAGTTDSNGAGGGPPGASSAFLFQQQKDNRNFHAATLQQHQQQQHQQHQLHNSSTHHSMGASVPVRRNILPFQDNGQGTQRTAPKRRIIITDNNGVNQSLSAERCTGMVVTSPIPLVAREEEVMTMNVSPSAVRAAVNEELPDEDDRTDSIGGGGWQYDHVVLLDKRIKTYMCKRCFETLKTEQQIRNHLFCKMLANHVQCHVCLQLITSDTYPAHLQIHGVRPPDNIQIDD